MRSSAPFGRALRPVRGVALSLIALCCAFVSSCTDGAGPKTPPIATVDIALADTSLLIGDSTIATALARDSAGALVPSASSAWSTSDASVATVSERGVVRARSPGIAQLRATVGAASTSRAICVRGGATQLHVVSGDDQRLLVQTSVAQLPVIRAADANGNAIPCLTVRLTTSPDGASVAPVSTTTDAGGVVRVQQWTLSKTKGTQTLLVAAEDASLAVHAEALPGPPSRLDIVSGSDQIAALGQTMAAPLVVRVFDQFGNALSNIAVAFRPEILSAVITTPDVATDSTGSASTTIRVSALGKAFVSATVSGLLPVRFALTSTGFRAKSIVAGVDRVCALDLEDVWYCWGNEDLTPTLLPGSTGVTGLTVGMLDTCGIAPDTTVRCWGTNESGQLGIGVITPRSQELGPVQPIGLSGVSSVFAGNHFTCAITRAGETWCWGYDQNGELGLGTQSLNPTLQPTRQPGNVRFTTLATTSSTPCGLDAQGVAYCWGFNGSGSVGDETFVTPRLQPTPVATQRRFRSIVSGSCALTADGQAYCWGYNLHGELGDGTTITRPSVAPILTDLRWQQLSSGPDICGIATDERVLCWGLNLGHSLGTTNLPFASVPTPVAPGFTAKYVAVGYYFTCAISEISEVLCWGNNNTGVLGDGTRVGHAQPAPVHPPGVP